MKIQGPPPVRLGPQFFHLKAHPVSSNVSYPLSAPNTSSIGFCSQQLRSSVFACFSSFEGEILPCGLTSLMELRRGVDFQFVRPISCCACGSDNFQAFYMSDREPEIPSLVFQQETKQNKTFELKNSWQFYSIAVLNCSFATNFLPGSTFFRG